MSHQNLNPANFFARNPQRIAPLVIFLCLTAVSALSQSLVEFDFNEGTGKTVASKVGGLVGTLGATNTIPANVPTSVPGPSGAAGDHAVQLQGTGFLAVDDRSSPILMIHTNTFTVEAWVLFDPSDARVNEGIISYGTSGGTAGYKLGFNNRQLRFTLYTIVDINSGLFVPLDGAWHHVAVVWQPGVGATFYMDGGNETFRPETRAIPTPAGNFLTVGAERFTNPIMAALDRVRIHSGALAVDQLDSVADAPKPPLATTLLAYGFNETQAPYQSADATPRPAIPASNFSDYLAQLSPPTFSSDTPSGQPGDFSLQFASGQKVVVPDPNNVLALDPSDPSFTLQAWLKLPAAQASARSVWFYANEPNGAISASITNAVRLFVTTLGIVDQTSNALVPNDNKWHHVAIIHENGVALRFYIDGVLADTVDYTRGVTLNRTELAFYFGGESVLSNSALFFTGLLDRFRYARGVLQPNQLDSVAVPAGTAAPSLGIRASVSNNQKVISISWPASATGFVLQEAPSLTPPLTWTTVATAPTTNNQELTVNLAPSNTQRFYRLFKP